MHSRNTHNNPQWRNSPSHTARQTNNTRLSPISLPSCFMCVLVQAYVYVYESAPFVRALVFRENQLKRISNIRCKFNYLLAYPTSRKTSKREKWSSFLGQSSIPCISENNPKFFFRFCFAKHDPRSRIFIT